MTTRLTVRKRERSSSTCVLRLLARVAYILFACGACVNAKVFDRCELAQVLHNKHRLDLHEVATWTCIAQHSSDFNTEAYAGGLAGGSHGLFQISDVYWCSPPGKGFACNLPCERLRDADLTDDLSCLRIIYDEHQRLSGDGYNAWNAYQQFCRHGVEQYVQDCFGATQHVIKPAASQNFGHTAPFDNAPAPYYTPNSLSVHTNAISNSYSTHKRGKVYERCELAQELYYKHKMPMEQIPTWVCIAQHESRFDTAAVGRLNADGSADHGLFQISDLYWCSHNRYSGGKACGLQCTKLLDNDITDDVRCIKRIHGEHTRLSGDGFTAWTVYNRNCQNQQYSHVSACFKDQPYEQSVKTTQVHTAHTHTFPSYQAPQGAIQTQYQANPFLNNHIGPAHKPSATTLQHQQHKYTSFPNTHTQTQTQTQTQKHKGKVYKRCELAQELYFKHKFPMQDIATWVCIAQHESNYDTAAVGRLNGDGSADHGLFQISDLYWCSHDSFGGKACNIPCTKLLDSDIGDDVQCVRIIYEEHTRLSGDGFTAWTVYNRNCRNRRLEEVANCFDSNEISKTQQFLTTTTTTTQVSSHSNNYNSKNNSITTTSTGLALPTTKGKIYKECELAQELYYKHHLPLADISTWVCIAKHESRYNTAAVGRLNADGSADHGLFQISDLYWCAHDAYGGKACNIPCHKLLDADISDDVQCIQTIHAEHTRLSGDGFTAWVVYNQHCRNQQWERIASCFPTELETHRMQPAVAGNVGTSAHTEVVTSVGKGKIYKKCELAQELYFKHKMPMQEVPTWVCIAEHESSFNTAAVGRLNADGSADHGLFQISDLYWCSHEVAGGKACHISCNKLLDNDITDDVRCVKTIYEEHTRLSGDGFTAWTVYNRNCRHQQLDRVSSCFDAKELQQAQKASGSTQPPTREPQHTRPTPSSTEKTKLHVYPTKPYVNSEIFRTTPVKAHGGATTTPKPARTTPMPQTQTTKQYYAALLTTTTTTRKPTTLATVVRKPTANSAVGTTKRPGTASTWNWRQPQQQILPTKSTTTRKTTIATRNPTSTTRKPTGTTRQPTSTSRKTTFSTTRAPQTTRRSGNIVQSAQKTETINTTKKSLTTKVPKTTKNPGLYQEKKTTWNTVTSTTTRRSQTTQTTVNQKIKNATTTKRPATTQNSSFKKPTTTTTTTRRPTTKQSVTKTTSRTANSQTANNKTNTPTTTRRTTTTVRRTTAATTTRPTRKATTPITVKTPITKKTSTTRRPTTTPTSLNNFSTTKVPYTVKKVTTTPTTFTQYTRTSTLKPKITTAKTTTTTNRPSTAATRKPAAHVASNTSFSTNISNKKSDTGSNKSTSTSAVIPTTNPYRDDPFSHPFFAKYKSQFEIFATTTTRKPTSTTRYQLQSRFGDESEYYQQFRNHTAGNVKTVYAYAFGQNGTVSGNYGK
ncbi:uncharacterized protein LOC105664879 isoform X2 [Ceratitis capitata]|uniref:uncharacterized protein LOC105664879 isoform X2 n=1 Tax=Ceratitis capitata TaxID=7213 RepID=UPI000A11FD24|nr:uncharacterized protein LOC105664879 isoform X2 [Ceratitis capitata]